MLLGSHLEEITSISTLQRRSKGSSPKIPANCPNGIKLYNTKIGGVDLMDQLKSKYQFDQRLKFWFYLCLFFDVWCCSCQFFYCVYETGEQRSNSKRV